MLPHQKWRMPYLVEILLPVKAQYIWIRQWYRYPGQYSGDCFKRTTCQVGFILWGGFKTSCKTIPQVQYEYSEQKNKNEWPYAYFLFIYISAYKPHDYHDKDQYHTWIFWKQRQSVKVKWPWFHWTRKIPVTMLGVNCGILPKIPNASQALSGLANITMVIVRTIIIATIIAIPLIIINIYSP